MAIGGYEDDEAIWANQGPNESLLVRQALNAQYYAHVQAIRALASPHEGSERASPADHGVLGRLPLDSAARKKVPVWTFINTYFPDVIIAMAALSYAANEKHNPGQPLHWSREKSGDHKDCLLRHLFDEERIDPETGQPEAVAAAWRACANAQLVIEKLREKNNGTK